MSDPFSPAAGEAGRWAEIAIAARGDFQEIAGALLTETGGCHGVARTPDAVLGYLPLDERLESTLLALRAALDGLGGSGAAMDPLGGEVSPNGDPPISIRFVEEADWANAWKQFFKPQRLGNRLVIKPTWEPWRAAPSDVVIEIDPGMAFGTGLHATTRLCLLALEEHVRPGSHVADVGTGSGILAVAAARLGAARVAAVDVDPLAVRIARDNVTLNEVSDRVSVSEGDAPPPGVFDMVVANILADVILEMLPALRGALRPGGLLIASGIIDTRANDVRRGLEAAGFVPGQTRTEGEWVAIEARAPNNAPGAR